MGIEAVPEVLAGHRVPGPVGLLGVEENDPGAVVLVVIIGPDVEIPRLGTALGLACPLEPRVLVGGVVDDQFGDDPQVALVGFGDETPRIGHGAVVGTDATVLGNVITIVAPGRWIERQQPDGVDAQVGDVVQLGDQTRKVADTVVVGIEIRFDVYLIDHRVLVPERVLDEGG